LTYLRVPYTIDFTSPATDIPYTDVNVQAIIMLALDHVATSQREPEQSMQVIQQEQFNNTIS